MIDYLRAMPTSTVVADFGCGDAKIAHTLTKHKVLSFDLVAKNDKVVACDIAKVSYSWTTETAPTNDFAHQYISPATPTRWSC
jgi:hypothetical protein